jgi:hypothetical protein
MEGAESSGDWPESTTKTSALSSCKYYAYFSQSQTLKKAVLIDVQADEIFLFGGTSPYDGPELYFSPDQQELMPDQPNNLIDHNDLYVLDLSPSLRTLCIDVVIKFPELFDISELPSSIRYDLKCMTTENNISKPLPLQTLPLG